jgi:hypothetical protein
VTVVVDPDVPRQVSRPGAMARVRRSVVSIPGRVMRTIQTIAAFAYHLLKELF